MQVNNSSFAQVYQAVNHPSITDTDTARVVATTAVDFKQTQNNLDTYTEAYQNATNSDNSASSDSPGYSDLQNINQAVRRQQISNSDLISNYIDRQQEASSPVTYSQAGLLSNSQAGSVINAYA
ncbi:hypothetical protein [Alkalimarinus coralli]|uniref:hypothetical protein n=1 Tax=Alkalimarinus coralli TaxID=2935863 RepID=UPI00202AF71E|nr:hypothetical protein [Alkalimarinus coralli]